MILHMEIYTISTENRDHYDNCTNYDVCKSKKDKEWFFFKKNMNT